MLVGDDKMNSTWSCKILASLGSIWIASSLIAKMSPARHFSLNQS